MVNIDTCIFLIKNFFQILNTIPVGILAEHLKNARETAFRWLKNTETECDGTSNERVVQQHGHSRVGGKSPYGSDMRQF